jgi:hypothetical protein
VVGTEVSEGIPAPGLAVVTSFEELAARGPFDCITLWHSLEHLPDPGKSLVDLAGMLVPEGTLVVAVPNAHGWQARLFRRHWLHLDVPRHLHHFGESSLSFALESAGLAVERVRHHELEYDVFGWIQSALNWLMPRPNLLFGHLTGRPRQASRALVALNVVLAALLLAPALAATAVSSWAGQGGTLVVAARRAGTQVA